MNEIPRYFRDDGEYQQVDGVFLPVMGVDEAFCYEEREEWECSSSDVVHDHAQAYRLIANHEQGLLHVHEVAGKKSRHVVYQHGKACDEFQNRSAHSFTSDIVTCLCLAALPCVLGVRSKVHRKLVVYWLLISLSLSLTSLLK